MQNAGTFCPANSSVAMQCTPGYVCATPTSPMVACAAGTYCPPGSYVPIKCADGTFSTATKQSTANACQTCATCGTGMTELAACLPNQNRVCTTCSNVPANAHYTGSGCSYTCNDRYTGVNCDLCPAGFWCADGVQNKCPLYSTSTNGSVSQDQCTCSTGYISQGTFLGTSPCVPCPQGSLCPGGSALMVNTTLAPLTDVNSQLMLVQQPLPPAQNLVSLLLSVKPQIDALKATLPAQMTVFVRQVCRGTYCIACDGTDTCVPYVWVGIYQGRAGKYTFNVSSVNVDSVVRFSLMNKTLCAPTINLPTEYLLDYTVALSAAGGISSIGLTCPTNQLIGASLPVLGASAQRRRTLLARRKMLQYATMSQTDSLAMSIVVPSNLTNSTQEAIASANLTIQGYMPVDVSGDFLTSYSVQTCPENSTSPFGSSSVRQCVCLPGYQGNASLGQPCTPCPTGVFCSGGLYGLCPAHATAPPMSSSAADCKCNPGYNGTTSCSECPANTYCPLGSPTPIPCMANAVSSKLSGSLQSCYCKTGYALVGNACVVCPPGFWCWTGVSNPCPLNRTSPPGSSRSTDCTCFDGYAGSNCAVCDAGSYCKVRVYRIRIPAPRDAYPVSFTARTRVGPLRHRSLRPRPVFKRYHQLLPLHR